MRPLAGSQGQGFGCGAGGEALDISFAINQKFLKIPSHVTGSPFGVGRIAKVSVEGRSLVAVHVNLRHQREGYVVLAGGEIAISAWVPGSCAPN